MNIKFFLIIFFLITLVSCGPIYKDFYDYHQPQDREGRYCVNSCDSVNEQCLNSCSESERECELKLREVDARKEENCYRKKEYCLKNPSDTECVHFQFYSCSNSSSYHSECTNSVCKSNCRSRYDQCFVNCGGAITKRTECIYGCK